MDGGEQTTSGLNEWFTTPRQPDAVRPKVGRSGGSGARWAIAGALVLLVGAAALLGALAWRNNERAEAWRASFAALQVEHDAALSANEDLADANAELSDRVRQLSSDLESSQEDVAGLEGRLSDLAQEKAGVEDEREFISIFAERPAEVAVAYDELAGMFRICVREQSTFTDMMIDFDLYWNTGTTYLVSEQAVATGEACGEAEAYLVEIRRYVDSLSQ